MLHPPILPRRRRSGTSFVVATSGVDTTTILESEEFPTTHPEETLGRALAWYTLYTQCTYEVRYSEANSVASLAARCFHLPLVLAILRLKQRKISSLGIASFGPVDLNTKSATYVRMRAMQCRHVLHMTLL